MNRILVLVLAAALYVPATVRAQASDGMPETPVPTATAQATSAPAAKDAAVKGLSWLEISTFSPGLHPVDDAFVKRMEATWHLKLRTFRRNAQFAALLSFDPTLKAAWKKIAEECKRIIHS